MTNQQFRYLFNGWLAGTLTPEESEEFFRQVSQHPFKDLLHEELESELEAGRFDGKTTLADRERILASLKRHKLFNQEKITDKPVHRVPFLQTGWLRIAAAILIVAGIGAYLWLLSSTDKPGITQTTLARIENDVKPGGDKAILTLSDGSEIMLDSAANGQLAMQQGAEVIKLADGQIRYKASSVARSNAEVIYNTMSTPKGGQYQVTLPDGTKAWLNAASRITYPTAFNDKTREVRIDGEVYFEVAQNPKKPFKVFIEGKPAVEVLGTHFNINAYKDEPVTATTLIEGAVKTKGIILKPGQQARVSEDNKIAVEPNADIVKVMAWKNGKFNFEDLNVEEVMKLITRWYDIEVVYANKPPDVEFFGSMSRNVPLSTVLKLLEGAKVRFTIEGKKLIVR